MTNELKNEVMTLEDGLSLYEQIETKAKELEKLEADFKVFKSEFMRQMEAAELESVKKRGFIFTIVKRTSKEVNEAQAENEIEQSGKKLSDYLVLDRTRFEMDFPKSTAITKKEGAKYLKITAPKGE
jgi:hypothetical protein